VLIARAGRRDGSVHDVRVDDGRITEIEDRLRPQRDEDVIDARRGALVPGLHDHHVHLRALAAYDASIDAGPSAVRDAGALRDRFAAASRTANGDCLRAVAYHESVAGDLDRDRLDELAPAGVAVRVQHRSGALWVLNSEAVARAGLDRIDEPGVERDATGRVTGRLWRRDDLVRRALPGAPPDYAALAARAAAFGVTGFTDATPHATRDGAAELARDLRAAGVPQRLHLMGARRSTPPADATLGPVKVLLDDDTLPAIDDLAASVRAAHDESRAVAVHCVTRVQLIVALNAFDGAGARAGDRIEHGSVVPTELVDELRRMRLTVVTQPHFVAERGDEYLRDVDAHDVPDLYRCGSLLAAGVSVAAGTDAPFGAPDPWASITAAVTRRTRSGRGLGADERVDVPTALDLYLGAPDAPARPRAVHVGAPADLCVLHLAWDELAPALPEVAVRATIIAGALAFSG
jgi:predicted amidohydrolase YtcJ